MADITKDVCILDIRELNGGLCTVRFVLWLKAGKGYPAVGAGSAYPDIVTDEQVGNSGQQILAAITDGTIVEEVYSLIVPSMSVTGEGWKTVVEPYIEAILNTRQKYREGGSPRVPDPGARYKVMHDTQSGWSD